MKKLKLDLDTLAVDSFRPSAEPRGHRGTVRGNEPTYTCRTWEASCNTLALTCAYSCADVPSCQISC